MRGLQGQCHNCACVRLRLCSFHLNGIYTIFFWTNGGALVRTKGIEPYHLTRGFGCQWARSGYILTSNMAAELPVVLDVLADRDLQENDCFREDDDDFIFLAAAASIFAICNLQV